MTVQHSSHIEDAFDNQYPVVIHNTNPTTTCDGKYNIMRLYRPNHSHRGPVKFTAWLHLGDLLGPSISFFYDCWRQYGNWSDCTTDNPTELVNYREVNPKGYSK